MDYQILQGIRLRIQPVHHELPQLLISTCQAEGLKTYPAQASTFLSAMKTDKNVPQILDVDGDTTESPTVTREETQKGYQKRPRFDTQNDDINMGKVYGVLAYHQHPYGLLTAMNESIRPLAVNILKRKGQVILKGLTLTN